MKKIFIFSDWFSPGYKAGGPIRSVANFVEAMQGHYRLSVVCGDSDLGDDDPYPGITRNRWITAEKYTKVMYLSPAHQNLARIRSIIGVETPDFIYLQGMYSWVFTICPLWLLYRHQLGCKVVIAPRGMLQEGAVQYKKLKKICTLKIVRVEDCKEKITIYVTQLRVILFYIALGKMTIFSNPRAV